MERKEYERIYKLENLYWWYKGNRSIVFSLLKGKYSKILDAGCGTGINLIKFKKYGNTEGIDISDDALRFCRKRGLKVKKGSVESLPYKSNHFDLVTCFEVIYHKNVKDDLKALKEFHRVLKKGGKLVIRVPALDIFYGKHDLQVHTRERYSKKKLSLRLKKAGFVIKKISYVNFLLSPIVLVSRFFQHKKKAESDLKDIPNWINSLLTLPLKIEGKLIKVLDLPFGSSLLAIAKK